jgi:TfoX/Sxy family transcriptional regulator of competence genes
MVWSLKWDKPSDDLLEILSRRLTDVDCRLKKIFGQYAFFLNGNMLAGVHQSDIFLRLSSEDLEWAMNLYKEIRSFEPKPGTVMKEYIVVPESIYMDDILLEELVNMSVKYVSQLPRKIKKKPKKKLH